MSRATRRLSGTVAALSLAVLADPAHPGQINVFQDLYDLSNPIALDNADAAIARNGNVVFLDITDFATDEKVVAIDQNGPHVLVDSTGPLVPLNSTGPGISDNGLNFAFKLRETVPNNFPVDRLFRTTIGGPLIKVAEPGDLAVASTDPIGAVLCNFTCNILDDGSVYFETFSPFTLSFGDGGDIETFARGNDIGVTTIQDYRASNNGFAAAVLQTGIGADARQEFVIGVREIDDPGDPGYNPDQAENANVFLDTDGVYREFRFPNVTDAAGIAIIGDRDTGGQDILARVSGQDLEPRVTTAGFYDSFDNLSFGLKGDLVFMATLDVPGAGTAIYTGPDPVADRLVGPGDVLFGKTVTRVELAPYDAINDNGQVVFAVRFADDTAKIVKAVPIAPGKIFEYQAQVSTGSGGLGALSQLVAVPGGLFDLSFQVERLAGDAPLELLFGGQLLQRITEGMFGTFDIEIDPFDIFGSDLPDFAELSLRVQGGPGTTFRIGDLRMEGLVNGDFSRGYLDGWTITTQDGGVVSARAVLSPVPLPAGFPLMLAALLAFGVAVRRRTT